MAEKYEYKTYGTARVFLEAGEYTISDLEHRIAFLKDLNAMARKSLELSECVPPEKLPHIQIIDDLEK